MIIGMDGIEPNVSIYMSYYFIFIIFNFNNGVNV